MQWARFVCNAHIYRQVMTTENKNDDTTTIARRAGILPPDHCDLLKYMIKLH